ncbi:MAG: acylphosphatase [Phycisphaerales bacterium JB061]|jgi:acylphosphatase
MERLAVRFTGLVQGVGFRMTAQAVAKELGLTGWVRNEADGSVLMHVQGPPEVLARCLEQIPRKTFGRVDNAQSSPLPVERDETGFEIRH